MIQRSKLGLNFFPWRFRRHVYLRELSIVVMRDKLQSRYLRRRVAHKQLARTSLSTWEDIYVFFTFISKSLHFIPRYEFKSGMWSSLILGYEATDVLQYLCTPNDLIVLHLLKMHWCISSPLSAKQHDVLITTPTANTQLFLSVIRPKDSSIFCKVNVMRWNKCEIHI